ncbi:hypothetical protein JTE90_027263 [Oedothorax gibbosus]|uniref:Uncharacterized protein n=1 Tax=Oedothorax gibbosus TaxID=931172 RepID=A0AAV6W0N1_9ARAC|nr:hypothetical protein JTE90_027263 [Oedothorax gibbosus]
MNFRALKSCSRLFGQRTFTTSKKSFRTMEEFKELQRQFQVDDGVPIYLKRGARDRIYFTFVLFMLAGGLANAGRIIYTKVFPPKPQQ